MRTAGTRDPNSLGLRPGLTPLHGSQPSSRTPRDSIGLGLAGRFECAAGAESHSPPILHFSNLFNPIASKAQGALGTNPNNTALRCKGLRSPIKVQGHLRIRGLFIWTPGCTRSIVKNAQGNLLPIPSASPTSWASLPLPSGTWRHYLYTQA